MNTIKLVFASLVMFLIVSNSYSQTPINLGVNLGANIPMGDFNKVYKTGISGEATIYYSLPIPGLDLSLSFGYNGFKFKNEYFTDLIQQNLGVTTQDFAPDWTATDIPIMVGGKFRFPAGSIQPYVTGEIGLHMMSFSERFNGNRIIGSSSNPTNLSLNGTSESGSETGFGVAIGAGIEIPLVPKIGIDLGLKYYTGGIIYSKSFTVFLNNNQQFTNPELKNISFLTARGGIVIHL